MFLTNAMRGVIYKNLSSIWKAACLSNDDNLRRNIKQAITNICNEIKMSNPTEI